MSHKRRKQQSKYVWPPKVEALEQINFNAAGVDIGSSELWVCVPEGRDEQSVKRYYSFTQDLLDIVTWLKHCKVDSVAMESTGIYWIPLYDILEQSGFEVYLVNARHVKNLPGRKTDILDCQWLQQLHTYGLLTASVRPAQEIRILRDLSRHKDNLIRYRAAHIQHMQKALHLMNIQLDNVISDITGKTGMKIIRAIVAGQRDPKNLSQYRDRNCKHSRETIEKSLEGNYSAIYVFELKQALELYDFYTNKIRECDQELERYYQNVAAKIDDREKPLPPSSKRNSHSKNAPDFDLRHQLYRVCGVDLTEIDGLNSLTVQTVITETGIDMSKWLTEKHFCSWLCLSPHNAISGGKVLKTKTKKTTNRANKALRQAAQSLHHSKSALGAYYRRMRVRLGAPKAITATAHKLARIIYIMLKEQKSYVDIGADYYQQKFREREIKKLKKRAAEFGYQILPKAA
jgi:transposase